MKVLAFALIPINLLIAVVSIIAIKILDSPSVSISAALAGNTATVNDGLAACYVLAGAAVIALVTLIGLLLRRPGRDGSYNGSVPGTNHLFPNAPNTLRSDKYPQHS